MKNFLVTFLSILLLAGSTALSGEVVDLRLDGDFLDQSQGIMAEDDLAISLGLAPHENLRELRQHIDSLGQVHVRYEQTFKGVPVWGHQVVLTKIQNGMAMGLHGSLVVDIDERLDTIPTMDANSALIMAQDRVIGHGNNARQLLFDNESSDLVIYLKGKKAKLAYAVSFFGDSEAGGEPTRPTMIIDAHTGQELFSFEGLTTNGTGPGGNGKTGKYHYGNDYASFPVSQSGSTCTMQTTKVRAVNMNHGTGSTTTAYSYTCNENSYKAINGAFSPINDAYNFSLAVTNMFSSWYGTSVLTGQLIARVHYSNNYQNAFWNGSYLTFGDGYTTFYPLVSLDVVAHEAAHGFTEQNSGLIYSGQSGGINEAFSDMAGEAAEYYMNATNDYLVGADIYKSAGALRYMANPSQDGQSINTASQYTSGMDVHYSSGVFNKAFYHLTRRPGWNTRKAFYCFLKANRDYWTPSSTFQSAAVAVYDAAADLGYNQADVAKAFEQVGITVVTPPAQISASISGPTSGVAGTFFFTANVSNAVGSITYVWRRNGTVVGSNSATLSTFLSSGTHTISLTATASNGTALASKSVFVFNCLIPSCECAYECP